MPAFPQFRRGGDAQVLDIVVHSAAGLTAVAQSSSFTHHIAQTGAVQVRVVCGTSTAVTDPAPCAAAVWNARIRLPVPAQDAELQFRVEDRCDVVVSCATHTAAWVLDRYLPCRWRFCSPITSTTWSWSPPRRSTPACAPPSHSRHVTTHDI